MKRLKDRYDIKNIQDNDIDGFGMKKYKSRVGKLDIDMRSLKFDQIAYWDAPDFVDAYICEASFTDGTDLTDEELDELNEDSQFVHDALQDYLY